MKRPRILLVDDEPDVVTLLRQRVEAGAYRALAATSEAAAVEAAQRERPDLVVLDLQMPRDGGMGVLRTLRADARTRHIPVIVYTGLLSPQLEREVFAAGAQDILRKPYDGQLLMGKIRFALDVERDRPSLLS